MFDARSGAGRKEYRWKRAAACGFVRFFEKRTGSSASSNSTSAQDSTPAMAVSAAGAPLGSEQMDVVDLLVWPQRVPGSSPGPWHGPHPLCGIAVAAAVLVDKLCKQSQMTTG
jgi:hypothetical protein